MTPPPGDSAPRVRTGVAVAVFFASLLVVLLLVEVASRKLLPNRFFVWSPNFTATFDAGEVIRHGVTFPGKLSINADGMRGDLPSDTQAYRILAVGGSTTICVYLDDAKVWPRLLQERLNVALGEAAVWVGNVGRPGHSTDEHVLQVEKLLAQDPEIDALVLLVGINDLLRFLPRADEPRQPSGLRQPSGWEEASPRERLGRAFSFYPGWDEETPWYLRNFVTRISRLVTWHPLPLRGEGNIRPMGEKAEWLAYLRRHRASASRMVPQLPDLRDGLAEYAANLNRIVDVAHREGVRVLLVTQPTLWRAGLSPEEASLLWAGGPPWNRMRHGAPYFSADALARGMLQYNAALLEVCREHRVECLDAAGRMPRTPAVFYDDAHFTEHGSELLAGLLSDHLLEREAALRAGGGQPK
jgi:lysophospholipase L1-like esterase